MSKLVLNGTSYQSFSKLHSQIKKFTQKYLSSIISLCYIHRFSWLAHTSCLCRPCTNKDQKFTCHRYHFCLLFEISYFPKSNAESYTR